MAIIAGEAVAQPEAPQFWTWEPPLQTSVDTRFVELIRIFTSEHVGGGVYQVVSGADAAYQVLDEAQLRPPGKVAVLLQRFGKGDSCKSGATAAQIAAPALTYHSSDAITGSYGCETPWMANGIAEASSWMEDFIVEYLTQDPLGEYAPVRFHFDTEISIAGCCTGVWAELFDRLLADARWENEPVPGHGGLTMSELYADSGYPGPPVSYDETKSENDPANRAWHNWYNGVAKQAVDGAMDEAVYSQIRLAWPGCLSSDYGSSLRIDGVSGRKFRSRAASGANWSAIHWHGFGDLQAPVLYPPHHTHAQTGEAYEDAFVRYARELVDACIRSYGGGHRDEISPWIPLIGQPFDIGQSSDYVVTEEDMRRLLTVLRSRGVAEFLVWNNPNDGSQTSANWDSLTEAVDDVWYATIDSVTVSAGTGTITASELYYADEDTAGVQGTVATGVEVTFDVAPGVPAELRVWVESSTTGVGVTGDVEIWDAANGNWESPWSSGSSLPFSVGSGGTIVELVANSNLADYISSSDQVKIRVTHHGGPGYPTFRSYFDVVQLVRD